MTPEPTHDAPSDAPLPSSKPVFLRRVQIRNYKSIAFCDVTLEPLTILVGRNATGKSNFLDALGFLRDLMEMRATDAVNARKGWRSIHLRDSTSPRIEMRIQAVFESQHSQWDADYSFALEAVEHKYIRVHYEELTLKQHGVSRECGFSYRNDTLSWTGQVYFNDSSFRNLSDGTAAHPEFFTRLRSARLLLSIIGYQPFLDFSESLRVSRFYNFSPEDIRQPQQPLLESFLMPNGSNLASVYKATKAADPDAVKRAKRYLNAIAPSVEFVDVVPSGGHEVMEFDTSGNVDDWNGPLRKADRFPAASMSDGTLRAFAALMAAFQTVNPYGSPSLVAIEEPETALHPAAMRALVAALDEATWRTQILITTHSPDLLDGEEVKPANVRIVQLVDGHTVIGPVDEASVEIVKRELNTLAGLERGDQLFPDLDDQDRQKLLARNESGVPA